MSKTPPVCDGARNQTLQYRFSSACHPTQSHTFPHLVPPPSWAQMQDGSSPAGAGAAAAANAAAMQQMMMGGAAPARQLPLPYLMSSLTQFSRPVKYPDHDLVIDTRLMEKAVGTAPDGKQARGLVRQVKARLLQLRQAHANKERMQRSFRNATLAGGKVGAGGCAWVAWDVEGWGARVCQGNSHADGQLAVPVWHRHVCPALHASTLWLPSLHILRCPAGHAGTSAACYQARSLCAPARHLPLPSARAL